MRNLRIEATQWSVALLCAATGALVYVAPHQFNSPIYSLLQPGLRWWGGLCLLAGLALVGVAVLKPNRRCLIIAHLLAGTALLSLAASMLAANALAGGSAYVALGLGTVLGPLWRRSSAPVHQARSIELLSLLIGLGGIAIGLLGLTTPQAFSAPSYREILPVLHWYALAFLASGLLLIASQLRPWPRMPRIVAHLLVATVFLIFELLVAVPSRIWAGLAYFGFFGLLIALLPWLEPMLRRIDLGTLRSRLAITLSTTTALVLIATTALTADQQERAVSEAILSQQEVLAYALADDLARSLELLHVHTSALANRPDLLDQPAEDQRRLLTTFMQENRQISLVTVLDANGVIRASSDGRSGDGTSLPAFAKTLQQPTRSISLSYSPWLQQPVVSLGVPITDPGSRQLRGLVNIDIEPKKLAAFLAKAPGNSNTLLCLFDEHGRIVYHTDEQEFPPLRDIHQLAPIKAVLEQQRSGAMPFRGLTGDFLAGYTSVPEWSWGMLVKQRTTTALASVRAGREQAFGLLLAAIGLTGILGILLASRLTASLRALSSTVGRLTTAPVHTSLLSSSFTEVRQLSAALVDLQTRLGERTRERERAEARLRFLAEAGVTLTATLELPRLLQTVAQLATTSLADYSLVYHLDANNMIAAIRGAHTDPDRATVIDTWCTLPLPETPVDLTLPPTIEHALITNSDLDREQPLWLIPTPAHRELLRTLRPDSHLIVPLRAREQTLGLLVLGLTAGSRHTFGATETTLAVELARRAAQAVDNARLYHEASDAIKAREEFLSIAAHELRTPLTTVKGYVQLIGRQIRRTAGLDNRNLGLIEQLDGQVARLELLVVDLLEISRLQRGWLEMRLVDLDLTDLARVVIDRFQHALERTPRHILRLTTPEPVYGRWDADRLDQVLTNLISNALKYSPEGGRVEVGISQDDGQAVIRVSDQGIGIAPEQQPTLFQPFSRLNSNGHGIKGTGLGLYIVHQIVTRHGGTIDIESQVNRGSCFTVRLPPTIVSAPEFDYADAGSAVTEIARIRRRLRESQYR